MSRVIESFEWVIAFASAMFVVVGVSLFPEYQLTLSLLLLFYGGLLYRFPYIWPYVLVFITVAVNLAPWTGRYVIDELDFFIGATVSVLSFKSYGLSNGSLKPLLYPCLYALLLILTGISSQWFDALGPTTTNFYFSDLNKLVVVKGPVWALLITWISFKQVKLNWKNAVDHLHLAFVMGGIILFFIVLWERQVLPLIFSDAGLWSVINKIFDFTSPYRATGIVSGMHTGGESIDGIYLIFISGVLASLLCTDSRAIKILSFISLGCLLYCVLVGFTRTTYAATGTAVITAIIFYWLNVAASSGNNVASTISVYFKNNKLQLIGFIFLLYGTFITYELIGFYSIVGSTFCLFVSSLSRLQFDFIKMNKLLVLTLATVAYFAFIYDSYKDSQWISESSGNSLQLIFGGGIVCIGSFLSGFRQTGTDRYKVFSNIFKLTIIFAFSSCVLVIALSGTRISIRNETAGNDLLGRIQHWEDVINSTEWDWKALLIGGGPGSFPANYALTFPERIKEIGNIDFTDGQLTIYPGKDVMVGQRLDAVGKGVYQLIVEHKSSADSRLNIGICRRNLIIFERWNGRCDSAKVNLSKSTLGTTAVTNIEVKSDFALFNLPPTLTIKIGSGLEPVVLKSVSLKSISGVELIDNNTFDNAMDNWFFYYDFEHLPWHIKNLYVSQFYQFGLIAFLLFFGLMIAALKNNLTLDFQNNKQIKITVVSALVAYFVFGTFGDPLDSARASFWFFYLLFAGQYSWSKASYSKKESIV